jgi:integrase
LPTFCRGILDDAVKGGRIPANKARGVDNLPRKTAKRHVYLTVDDVDRLATESGLHRVLVLVLAYCGLRWSEVIALRVADVDFERKRLSVSTGAVQIGSQHDVGTPKHHKMREVPVAAFLLDELARVCDGKAADDLVFPRPGAPGAGDYLRRPTTDDGWFAAAVRRARVQRVTPHELRHTYASLAISAGVNVLALQRMLGHASAKLTLDTYADPFDTDLDAVAEALNKVATTVSS